ncbi:MAG: AAA family ATPase [Chitinophagaceae bacterium]
MLRRRKFILIAVPLLAVTITYFMVRKLPDVYISKTKIATGLADQGDSKIFDFKEGFMESKVNQQFTNLIQTIQLKHLFDQVGYRLILHDLTSDTPYKKKSKLVEDLDKNLEAKKHAIDVYTKFYKEKKALSLWDEDQNGLNKVIASMGYDETSLKNKLSVSRLNNSDFIGIEFESANSHLSAFVVNALTEEFLNYYITNERQNQFKAVDFLDSLLRQKEGALKVDVGNLKSYKIKNRILNLNEQAKILYTQIADFETKKELTIKNINAYKGALKEIDAKFDPKDKAFLQNIAIKIQTDIRNTTDKLKLLNEAYITSNYNPQIKLKIDSLNEVQTSQIQDADNRYLLNPSLVKQQLISEKVKYQIALDLEVYSLGVLEKELVQLNSKFDEIVPHEAVVQSYESAVNLATNEYIEILKKYNQTTMEASFSMKLRQVEMGMPGPALPSKKMILVVLSGLLSFVFCLVVFFVIFFFDESVKVPKELADKTNTTILGFIPLLKTNLLDLPVIWKQENDASNNYFKKLLRSTRFELDNELKDDKIVAITSIAPKEGKTILSLSLAYAYTMINKKVLLIDGNFSQAAITNITQPTVFLDDLLFGRKKDYDIIVQENIAIIGAKESDLSLFEIAGKRSIIQQLQQFKDRFDVILIEVPSLEDLNKAKEWISIADKVIAVFAANQTITLAKQQQIDYLKTFGNQFAGFILNKIGKVAAKKKSKKA